MKKLFAWLQRALSPRLREHARLERNALPDGTRVAGHSADCPHREKDQQ